MEPLQFRSPAAALQALGPGAKTDLLLDKYKVGMAAFICTEAVFFASLIVTYLAYLGAKVSGPTPRILALPVAIVNSVCLLSSSATVAMAVRAFVRDRWTHAAAWLGLTIVLGIEFLAGTAYEWSDLINRHGLVPSTNLFGSTFYTLIGFHALHVTIGLILLSICLVLILRRRLPKEPANGFELISWYWHFVDCVWVVIFSVVYVVGR
jgi:cytochrome c oxidase subunit III